MKVKAFILGLLLSSAAWAADDRGAIVQLLHRQFDQPGKTLEVQPLVVVNDHALLDWWQSGHGGRALLRKQAGKWQIVVCAGKALKQMSMLKEAGVAAADAEAMVEQLTRQESTLPTERLQVMDAFGMAHH